jgi:PKD repeat protein
MKPLNHDDDSCDSISSNCVIWQGDDIECINLCKGDTVSDVVNKLAIELCDIMDTLDVTNYDLSCFNLTTCSPENFQALIQLLIERICKLEQCTGCVPDCNGNSIPPVTPSGGAGCPDCIVPIASCFYFTNQFGDQVTSMQLQDYVNAIGNRMCTIASQIATINLALTDLNNRVTVLENTPSPTFEIPRFIPTGVLPPVSTDVLTITEALEEQFVSLRSATGTPDEIYQAIIKQCNALSTAAALGPIGGSMGSIPGWFNSPANMASSIVNMWLTICDLRAAVGNIKLNCCPDGCEGITIDLQLTFTGSTLKLFFTGTIPAGFQHCAPAGTMFTITDTSGGLLNVFVDVITNMNNINGFAIDLTSTPLNLLNNLTVVGTPCFYNNVTNATCQSSLQKIFYNTAICPILTLSPLFTSIGYSASTITGTANYTIEIWDASATSLITSFTQNIVGPGIFSGSIGPLVEGTLYKVRLVITVGSVSTECAFQNSTTLGAPCLAPQSVTAIITVPSAPITPSIYLNSACGFAILAGSTITTTGVTTVNGNVGLDPGSSITGPFAIIGLTEINTAPALAAKADLTAAYLVAEAATATTDLSGIDLGGLTLTPGVYKFTSSAALTGNLTLDGVGIYIFQIASTLTVDVGADVILLNGATPENIFWQVGSSATLGTASNFSGIVMALTSITGDATTVNGALMVQNGAVTFTGAASDVVYVGCI